jgi:hypothetical protein
LEGFFGDSSSEGNPEEGTVVKEVELSKFLYGVGANDPASLTGASLVLLTVAFFACYLPARRAGQMDPIIALHES